MDSFGCAYLSYSPSNKQFRLIQRVTYDTNRQLQIQKSFLENIKAHKSDEIVIELPDYLLNSLM